jgi:hypothetical protein
LAIQLHLDPHIFISPVPGTALFKALVKRDGGLLMKQQLILVLAIVCLFSGAALADVPFPQYTHVSTLQTGGPFISSLGGGFNDWDTPLQETNTGSSEVKVWFVWTQAFTRDSDGGLHNMTWNNALSEFEYTNLAGQLETASGLNQAFMLSLNPAITNIPIASGFGVDTSSTVDAFYVGDLAAGATGNWDVHQKLTTNMYEFYFNGSFVSQPVPEPGSLLLLGSGLVSMAGVIRRKIRK